MNERSSKWGLYFRQHGRFVSIKISTRSFVPRLVQGLPGRGTRVV